MGSRQNEARGLVGSNFTIAAVGGNRHTNSITTNVLYDFTPGFPITPHVGFGVGAANVFDGLKLPGIGQLFNNSSWQFGYQGIAGVRYNLSEVSPLISTIATLRRLSRCSLYRKQISTIPRITRQITLWRV